MGIDWQELAGKLRTEKDEESKQWRKDKFTEFDPNGNGYLSLAEVDKGVRDVLQCDDLFDCKPAIMRAFQAAKGVSDKKGRENNVGADYVERVEFRLLLLYLRQYFELYQMFDVVDTGDDRRVDIDEFKSALEKIEDWGLDISDAEEEFAKIDTNGGGQVLFDEFSAWALEKKLDLEDDDD